LRIILQHQVRRSSCALVSLSLFVESIFFKSSDNANFSFADFYWIIYIFIQFSPFSKLQKVLFAFGYLPFYEYLVISRNYAWGYCLFLPSVLIPYRKKSYLSLSLILFILANSNAYCLFISIALGLTLIVEYSLGKKLNQTLSASIANIIGSLIIFSVGIISSLAQLIPPSDSTLQGGLSTWTLQFDLKHLLTAITRIWNSYIVILLPASRNLDLAIFTILSSLICFCINFITSETNCLILYLLGTGEILLFTYVKF
jgi:hypothetical protein